MGVSGGLPWEARLEYAITALLVTTVKGVAEPGLWHFRSVEFLGVFLQLLWFLPFFLEMNTQRENRTIYFFNTLSLKRSNSRPISQIAVFLAPTQPEKRRTCGF